MEKIALKTPAEEIEMELTEERFLRKTNNANNEVYLFKSHDSEVLMREVGRLRELTFRSAGGGTGKHLDLDEYDYSEVAPHQQLIVWDPDNKEIIGGYRFLIRDNRVKSSDPEDVASASFFNFSRKFKEEFLPYLMELGRSFVQPDYQSRAMGRSMPGFWSLIWHEQAPERKNNRSVRLSAVMPLPTNGGIARPRPVGGRAFDVCGAGSHHSQQGVCHPDRPRGRPAPGCPADRRPLRPLPLPPAWDDPRLGRGPGDAEPRGRPRGPDALHAAGSSRPLAV